MVMVNEILKLKDGAITNIESDNWKTDGCPTCDYGAEYITELNVKTTGFSVKIEFADENDYVSTATILSVFLKNVNIITEMTERQFINWLIETLQNKVSRDCKIITSIKEEN